MRALSSARTDSHWGFCYPPWEIVSCVGRGEKVFLKFWFVQQLLLSAKSLQSCLTLCNPLDSSSPGSFVHGVSLGKNTGLGCHALLQGIFPTQGSNPHLVCLLHRQVGSLPLAPHVGRIGERFLFVCLFVCFKFWLVQQLLKVKVKLLSPVWLVSIRWTVAQRRLWHPTTVLLPGKSRGQRSRVGCSPGGR